VFTSAVPCQVCGLLVGQQSGDGVDGVAHVLAAAEMAGQGPAVLQVGDAVFDADTSRGVGFALSFVHLLVPVGGVLLELAVWRGDHPAAGLGTQALITGSARISPRVCLSGA
jgi:hypothetical protein